MTDIGYCQLIEILEPFIPAFTLQESKGLRLNKMKFTDPAELNFDLRMTYGKRAI